MQMLSVKTRDFIVSVFYDMRGKLLLPVDERFRMDIFLNSLRDEFEKKYYTDHLANFTNLVRVLCLFSCPTAYFTV